MNISQCSDFLRTLSEENKISPPLQLRSESKSLSFSLNREMEVEFRPLNPIGIALYALLLPCPIKNREELFIRLMQANFLTQGTGGAAIGLEQAEKNLSLSLKLPYELSYLSFKEHLEIFANYLEYWRKELS